MKKLFQIIRKDNIKLVMRHLCVSMICASIEFFIFIILYKSLNYDLKISYISSFSIATIIGFLMHNFFTFSLGGLRKRRALLFILQCLIILAIGYKTINIIIMMGIDPRIAKIIQLFITFWFNVAIGKYISFR